MTIDEAIKDLEYGSKQLEMEIKSGLWIKGSESELRCKEGIALNKQHIEWLTELKDLREENKVLTSECDRLTKEKGELLSKVSGGDVLRICQLEEQLEKAKRLLKAAMKDMNTLYETGKDEGCIGIKFKWRFADEALKLIGDESSGV